MSDVNKVVILNWCIFSVLLSCLILLNVPRMVTLLSRRRKVIDTFWTKHGRTMSTFIRVRLYVNVKNNSLFRKPQMQTKRVLKTPKKSKPPPLSNSKASECSEMSGQNNFPGWRETRVEPSERTAHFATLTWSPKWRTLSLTTNRQNIVSSPERFRLFHICHSIQQHSFIRLAYFVQL